MDVHAAFGFAVPLGLPAGHPGSDSAGAIAGRTSRPPRRESIRCPQVRRNSKAHPVRGSEAEVNDVDDGEECRKRRIGRPSKVARHRFGVRIPALHFELVGGGHVHRYRFDTGASLIAEGNTLPRLAVDCETQ